ncbi:MAG: ABC transporter ATP-binding protein, partial [Muribaculaceae bacterium]|nr:ABC transporter ATP-binding protein [Muribaculaceae bacterium]
CRLQLARVLMKQPNFLILDAPTYDLDIVTLGILEEYLTEFKGCVIVISHDRYFLDNVVDHLFVMEGNGVIKDFPGTYSEYSAWRTEQQRQTQIESKPVEAEKKNAQRHTERKEKLSFKERKEFEALEIEIEQLNAEKAELDRLFNSGETIDDVAAKSLRYTEISELLDEKEMRWLELSEKA